MPWDTHRFMSAFARAGMLTSVTVDGGVSDGLVFHCGLERPDLIVDEYGAQIPDYIIEYDRAHAPALKRGDVIVTDKGERLTLIQPPKSDGNGDFMTAQVAK